jgi:hypothetical protein
MLIHSKIARFGQKGGSGGLGREKERTWWERKSSRARLAEAAQTKEDVGGFGIGNARSAIGERPCLR